MSDGDAGDRMVLGWGFSVVTTVVGRSVMIIMVIILVTVMTKVNPFFFSGPLQNLPPPRRPGHSFASKTVPPAGCPGTPGVLGPGLHCPCIWTATQGPQWEGNVSRVLTFSRKVGVGADCLWDLAASWGDQTEVQT